MMREALEDLRDIRQDCDEPEEQYSKSLNTAIFRYGNVHGEDEKMAMYVDGLSDNIRTIVERHKESTNRHDFTFEDLCHFAKLEDTANRAIMAQLTPTCSGSNKKTPRLVPRPQPRGGVSHRTQLNALNEKEGADRLEGRVPVLLIDDQVAAATGKRTEDKLVESAQDESPADDELYLIDNREIRRKLPSCIKVDDGHTARVGWIEKRSLYATRATRMTI